MIQYDKTGYIPATTQTSNTGTFQWYILLSSALLFGPIIRKVTTEIGIDVSRWICMKRNVPPYCSPDLDATPVEFYLTRKEQWLS